MDHFRNINRDVHVRLSDDLYERLRMVAELEQRSIAGQVAAILNERLNGRTTVTFNAGGRNAQR